MFWGLTPALDLIEEFTKNKPPNSDGIDEPINILIVGGLDIRHVLKTLSRRRPHRQIHIHLVESSVENLARQLLLLYTVLQSDNHLGLVPKVKFLMEIYGNCLIRPMAAHYLAATAKQLISILTSHTHLKCSMPNVRLSLKFKERDYFETLLQFWAGRGGGVFDIAKYWNARVRQMLGSRFDAKVGAFDWDLHMRLYALGANTINAQEYRNFRQNGLAFTWLESDVSQPNRTLAAAVLRLDDDSFAHHGYLGDIQTGPFIAYGLSCDEDADFMRTTNGHHVHRATDITERNLLQYCFEVVHPGVQYEHRTLSTILMGNCVVEMPEKRIVDQKPVVVPSTMAAFTGGKCVPLDGVDLNLTTVASSKLVRFEQTNRNVFDVIYLGAAHLKLVDNVYIEQLLNVNAENSLLIIENQRYVLSMRDKDLEEYYKTTVVNVVNGISNLKAASDHNPLSCDYFQFVTTSSSKKFLYL